MFLSGLGIGLEGVLLLELSKGYYEVPIRPKSKVGFENRTISKPVSRTGEGLPVIERSSFGSVMMILACGWTTPKIRPPLTLE
jgi:hypothetical protein